jgi:O-methyltransferase
VHAGDVFDTVPAVQTGELAFVHSDLNAAAPTLHVLEHTYGLMVAGGIMLFDDYAFRGYEEQRRAIDAFMRDKPEEVIALPTGQGVLHKIA